MRNPLVGLMCIMCMIQITYRIYWWGRLSLLAIWCTSLSLVCTSNNHYYCSIFFGIWTMTTLSSLYQYICVPIATTVFNSTNKKIIIIRCGNTRSFLIRNKYSIIKPIIIVFFVANIIIIIIIIITVMPI